MFQNTHILLSYPFSQPETGDFVRWIVFREGGKHTVMKNNRFHEGDVNPATKTFFYESAPHTVLKINYFRESI